MGGSVGKYPPLHGGVGGGSIGDRITAWVRDGRESSAGQRPCPQLLLQEVEGVKERELESAPGSCNLSCVYFRLLPFCLCGCHFPPLVLPVACLWLP